MVAGLEGKDGKAGGWLGRWGCRSCCGWAVAGEPGVGTWGSRWSHGGLGGEVLFGTVFEVVWVGEQGEVLVIELGDASPCGCEMGAVVEGDHG